MVLHPRNAHRAMGPAAQRDRPCGPLIPVIP